MPVYQHRPYYVNAVQYQGVAKDLPEDFRKVLGKEATNFKAGDKYHRSCYLLVGDPAYALVLVGDYLVLEDENVRKVSKEIFEGRYAWIRDV